MMLSSIVNQLPAPGTEPGTSTNKGHGCISNYNHSVGPCNNNDDTTSQLSSHRQRRAQYHRMLTAGKHEEVERQISIEIQSNNQDAISLYTRAKLAEKQKSYESAIRDFGKVLELDPNFFNAAYAKAACENIIGRYDDAIATYNLAFSKDVEMPILVTQSLNSRISSKRGSPSHTRLTRKSSKLFGCNALSGSHSSVCGQVLSPTNRFRSIEPKSRGVILAESSAEQDPCPEEFIAIA